MRRLRVFAVGLLFAASAGAVNITGILETNSFQLAIDSVVWRFQNPPAPMVEPTPGWGGDSMVSDTFTFISRPQWPRLVKVFCSIRGGQSFYDSLAPVVRDSWYELSIPALTNSRVRFEETTYVGVEQQKRLPAADGFRIGPTHLFRGRAMLNVEMPGQGGRVRVVDAGGRVLFDRTLPGRHVQIDLPNLHTGVYVVRCVSAGRVASSKLVVH